VGETVGLVGRMSGGAGVAPSLVNLGGGFGIPYFPGEEELDIDSLGKAVGEMLCEVPAILSTSRFAVELGRWLVGQAGGHLPRVVAKEVSRGQTFLDQVRAAGQESGEELWQLPFYGEYRSLLDHPHADINNVGGRYGGTITAALFLGEFLPDTVKWAHLDIAGPAIQTGGWRYYSKGMTGFATRTLARVAKKLG